MPAAVTENFDVPAEFCASIKYPLAPAFAPVCNFNSVELSVNVPLVCVSTAFMVTTFPKIVFALASFKIIFLVIVWSSLAIT